VPGCVRAATRARGWSKKDGLLQASENQSWRCELLKPAIHHANDEQRPSRPFLRPSGRADCQQDVRRSRMRPRR
jgi:hypothetical protein